MQILWYLNYGIIRTSQALLYNTNIKGYGQYSKYNIISRVNFNRNLNPEKVNPPYKV